MGLSGGGGGEATKELLDILSGGGGDFSLPCSPPVRAANPLPFELCRRFEALQTGPAAEPRPVGDAKVKVVGFQPARASTSPPL